jgi:dTDP-4-amino-4,6-dideoxygalactose transaminase
MVACADSDLAERIRLLSLHGISKDAWKRYTAEGPWYYEVIAPGYKYNMTDIQAALGLHQLGRFAALQAERRRIVARYDAHFADLPEIIPPPHAARDGDEHAWHLYAIRLDLAVLAIDRARFIEELRGRGIGASVHFIPVHLHPYYRDRFDRRRSDYPRAEAAYDGLVSLPLYHRMTDADVDRVADAVRAIVAEARRPATPEVASC